jgi:hypothetical protein
MGEILAILHSRDTPRKSPTIDAQRRFPRLDITYGVGREHSQEWMGPADSIAVIDGLLKIFDQKSEIGKYLSEMKERLVQYLKNNSASVHD